SFQLHYLTGIIEPHSAAVLNIAEDHLDWHGGFEAYSASKAKIFTNTRVACVYNAGDEQTMRMVEQADVIDGARAIGFSVVAPRISEVGYVQDILCDRAFIQERSSTAMPIATLDDLAEIGVVTPHLMANVAAASALARAIGVSPEQIADAIRKFRLDAHRIQLIADANGISWYDDSKATNPHAAAASLASFDRIVWVVGGLLKGVDIAPLVKKFAKKLAAAVVIGAERTAVLEAFAAEAPEIPVDEIELGAGQGAEVMRRVVELAAARAVAGDTVLLAPAAASMDQFKDYAERGQLFAAAVAEHLGENHG
ncbi:MAG: UDP-N-acetylmuramoyl-L-alanine--D-glutamate ligase, partial [Micrococcales bacterium]